MATFMYKVKSRDGRILENSIEAETVDIARRKLIQKGMKVLSIEVGQAQSLNIGGSKKVKPMDIMMMTKQLATLLKAGVPILTSIQTLAKQIEHPTLLEAIKKIDRAISGGLPLSKALSEHPKIFDDMYTNVVIAGEVGGVLPEVLAKLADLIEKDNEISSEVRSALRYPGFVVMGLIGAFLFLINFVVPRFADLFSRFEMELPVPTQILIWIAKSLREYYALYALVLAGIFFGFKAFKKTPGGKRFIDGLLLRLPVIGPLTLKFCMTRFAYLMATLIKSGVPAVNCLDIVRKTINNKIIEEEFIKVRKSVESGSPIHDYMAKSKIFPPLLSNMIEIGEESGALEEMLSTVGSHYEMETRYSVKSLTGMIEPIMTILTGAMVLTMALAIFMPMWDMMKIARGKG